MGDPAPAHARATTGRSCGSARPGIVAGVVVDTAYFTGNYPPRASVDGAAIEGHCSVDELPKADWQPLLAAAPTWPATRTTTSRSTPTAGSPTCG